MRARGRAGWMALCAVISAACGRSGGPQGTAPAIVEVSIDPAAVAIAGGGTIRFIAAVAGTADAAVTWSTDGGTIDQSGIYTAPNAPRPFSGTARNPADPPPAAPPFVSV